MSLPLVPDLSAALGRPFVIVATQRTGSTLLIRSLDASPLIFCAGEIFHDGAHVFHAEYCYPRKLLGLRVLGDIADRLAGRRRVNSHLRRFFAIAGAGTRAVGFKVMVSQLRRYRSVLPFLVDSGATPFFLHRRDSFAAALSLCRARASGVYHSDQAGTAAAVGAITADADEFRALLDRCELARNELYALHAAHGGKLLAYEDMTADWDAFIASVGAELGIESLRLAKVLDKLSSAAAHIRIENEEALRRRFAPVAPS